jgi:hypothetical protein
MTISTGNSQTPGVIFITGGNATGANQGASLVSKAGDSATGAAGVNRQRAGDTSGPGLYGGAVELWAGTGPAGPGPVDVVVGYLQLRPTAPAGIPSLGTNVGLFVGDGTGGTVLGSLVEWGMGASVCVVGVGLVTLFHIIYRRPEVLTQIASKHSR